MRAVRIFGHGDVRLVDVPRPEPKAGEILIKIGAAGVCHSDLHIMDSAPARLEAPYTLGHENAGWVEECGEGVTGFSRREAVLVYGPWGCGSCPACQQSQENYCVRQHESAILGGGLGRDGGMAEYMIVPSERLLIRLGDLSPAFAAPVTDAALTPWHAIRRSAGRLLPGSTVLVLGVGGLGHMAIQMLKNTTPVTVIAGDVSSSKLAMARKLGADFTINTLDADAALKIISVAGEPRCSLVLDFVGIASTLTLASSVVGINGEITVVGLGGGSLDFSVGKIPFGARVSMPYWGSRVELLEVLDLLRGGRIEIKTETFPLSSACKVYQLLREGRINGRAVLIP